MSNALRRKTKKMEPKGFSKVELLKMRDNARKQSNTEAIIEDVFKNVQLIAYQILHDKYGFGQKRIIRLEATINTYLDSIANGELTVEHLAFYMVDKCKINVKEEANKVPFNERFSVTTYKIDTKTKPTTGMCILGTIYDYFILLGVCLKSQFDFSPKKILEAYEWIRYYINTLSRYKQFDLKIEDIAECLMEEVKYCDSRFVSKR